MIIDSGKGDLVPLGRFDDLRQARAALLNLKDSAIDFERLYRSSTELQNSEPCAAPSQEHRYSELVKRHQQWLLEFKTLLERPSMKYRSAEKSRAIDRLLFLYKIAAIQISSALRTDEVSFDTYVDEFEEAIALAESTIPKTSESIYSRGFASISFTKEFIAALYYTACKCRNPSIRRRALAILESSPREEMFGSPRFVTAIGNMIIKLEEEGLEEIKDSTGLVVPSEWARVTDIIAEPFGAYITLRQADNKDTKFNVAEV